MNTATNTKRTLIKKWGLMAFVCLAIIGGLALIKLTQIRAAIAEFESYPEPSATVEVFAARSVDYVPNIQVIGEIVSPQQLELRNEIAGEITAVNFESGTDVHQGQILVQLDIRVDEANLEAANARSELAQSVYQRAQALRESNAISQDQLDRAKADLATSKAEVKALKRTIDKKTLRSPFDGRAGLEDLEVGQYLAENTLLTTLVGNKDFMWLDFKVPQFYPPLPMETAVVVHPVTESAETAASTAIIEAESSVLTTANRSREYRARLVNSAGLWVANAMAEVQLPINSAQSMIEVPATAVQSDPLGKFVFVLIANQDGDGYRAKRQRVRVHKVAGDYTLIEEGLELGTLVAAAGAFKLQDGLLVYGRASRSSGGSDGDRQRVQDSSQESL